MSLPTLATLRKAGVPLVICARPWAADLLAGVLDDEPFIPMRGAMWHDRAVVHADLVNWRRAMPRRGGVAYGLALPDSFSSAAVFRMAGLRVAGYRDDGRSMLLSWPIAKPQQPLHAVQSWHYLARHALERWGLPVADEQPMDRLDLPLTSAHRAAAQAALAAAGLAERSFVLIGPTATGLHRGRVKVWPGYDELTRRLQERDIAVAMCPPPAEADEAARNAPDAIRLPSLGLGAFAALTTRATLVVCNDSGVSHLAAAAGARQLTLFGVTDRRRTGPWSPRAECLGSAEAWPIVEEVEQAVFAMLDEPLGQGRAAQRRPAQPAAGGR
jgi:heptosyltransferase-2